MLTLLADADVFAYKVASVCTTETEWEPGKFSTLSDGPEAVKQLDEMMKNLMEKFKADRLIMALSDTANFRKKIYKPYKSNRAGVIKPKCLKFIHQHITENYETFQRPGLEGDDVIGILATHPKLVKGDKLVVSVDKDFNTVPCTIYNPDKDETTIIDEETADYNHMLQTLTGDTCDGYPGCPGLGPVKANKLLSNETTLTLWGVVWMAYVHAGLKQEDALAQARCARILRAEDYDFKKKEPILWIP